MKSKEEKMNVAMLKRGFIVVLIAAMLVVSAGSAAFGKDTRKDLIRNDATDPAVMVVDFAAARPVGFAALVTGTVFFTASLPFSLIGGNTGEAFEAMVKSPARYTFLRPLGSF